MTHSAEIIIHINEKLDSSHRVNLSNKVQEIDGVISASVQNSRPHMMLVKFNSNKRKAYDVLTGVRDIGMHAQLVAWV